MIPVVIHAMVILHVRVMAMVVIDVMAKVYFMIWSGPLPTFQPRYVHDSLIIREESLSMLLSWSLPA
jgi:hypothetical protein